MTTRPSIHHFRSAGPNALAPNEEKGLEPTAKLAVATELLDRALLMYYAGDSYFAALHLAGAAEELLAVYVKKYGGTSSFESLKSAAVRMSKFFSDDRTSSNPKDIGDLLNAAKNSTKHMRGKNDTQVRFDARSEAKEMLDLAVTNYYFLMGFHELTETDMLRRFNAELLGD